MNRIPLIKRKSTTLQLLLIGATAYVGISFNTVSQDYQKKEHWKAPAWADTLVSPLIGGDTATFLAEGEDLFTLYCALCHGDNGHGDGAAGGALGDKPANFHDTLVTRQSDGALYWKVTVGKGNMPPFAEVFSEEQRWQLVAYLRELPNRKIVTE